MESIINQVFSSSLELLALMAVLVILSRLILDTFQVRDFGKRIAPEKISLAGQRRTRRIGAFN